jgi:hypothetical protein
MDLQLNDEQAAALEKELRWIAARQLKDDGAGRVERREGKCGTFGSWALS